MTTRRRLLTTAASAVLVLRAGVARGQEGVFLTAEQAPRSLYPDATDVIERSVASTDELKARIRAELAQPPSLWEAEYRMSIVKRRRELLGFVVIVEEIGKHRPITFAVAVTPEGAVHDIGVLAYREPYGGAIRERRFLKQYAGRAATAPFLPYRDIQNIAGATLSVHATGRAVKKAVAVLKATGQLR